MSVIVLVGGGTGGHLFAALSLSEELKQRNHTTYLVTDNRCKKYIHNLSEKVYFITSSSLNKGFLEKALSCMKIFVAVIHSLIFLLKTKPDLVVGFGGYPTFPLLFISKILNIPIMIHEQNSFLGKVNYYFSQYARVIAITFPDTANIPPGQKPKINITGNPIRADIKNLQITRNFDDKFLKLLVVGGSQGARFFAKLIPSAIKLAKIKEPNLLIEIIQQARKEETPYLQKLYTNLNIPHEICEFFFDIGEKNIQNLI